MFYLISLIVMLTMSMIIVWKGFPRISPGRGVCLLSAVLLAWPLFRDTVDILLLSGGNGMTVNTGKANLWLIGLGAALAVGFYGRRLYMLRHAGGVFLATGVSVLGIALGSYMLFIVADQAIFDWPEDAGFVNWGLVKTLVEVKDIQCQSDVILVSSSPNDEAITYRCPHSGFFVLGRFTTNPIIPWPGYSQGKSTQLKTALNTIMNTNKE